MKKSIMISLIVAGALVLFGAGLFAGAMTAGGWDFSILNTYEVVNNTYDVDEPFTNISIDTDTVDIRFAKSSDGKCRVATRDTSNHFSFRHLRTLFQDFRTRFFGGKTVL